MTLVLRNRYEEPAEGMIMATFIARATFTSPGFEKALESTVTLDELISKLLSKLPARYRLGVRKQPQESRFVIVYSKENRKKGGMGSNDISLTGKVLGAMAVEPSRRSVNPASLHIGFTYPCKKLAEEVLYVVEGDFIYLSEGEEPDIKKMNIKESDEGDVVTGNRALFNIFNCPREITTATIEGESLRKRTYTIAAEHA
ncbi:MAG: hypothetical protein AABW58_00175 [Nanoarchaeota archaeon]